MSVIYGLENVSDAAASAVAVGVFDGVHWGHRTIFKQLTDAAHCLGLRSIALTFDKHPAELIAPSMAPLYITTLEQRIELIESAGVDEVVVAAFEPVVADLAHDEFLRKILQDTLNAKYIAIGSNFRFGKNRGGDVRYLAEAAPGLGIGVGIVSSVVIDGGPVSSTRIRGLIGEGDMGGAARLLGRPFSLRGTVVTGNRIGRSIGFPTANLETAPKQLLPARGVYCVQATVGGAACTAVCAISASDPLLVVTRSAWKLISSVSRVIYTGMYWMWSFCGNCETR